MNRTREGMIGKSLKSLLVAFACGLYAFAATAAVSLFSDYGQIQNVQNYSSNPFWSPTAPYNQRLPQPVFATGADLTADDCIKVVQSMVSVQCMARDNCKNTNLSDIRPAVMVQLSNLPGANYVSSCSGYIDNIFESYKRQYGNSLPNRPTAFPNATEPNPDLNDSGGIKFENPYKSKPTKWQTEQKERADELAELQRQNGAGGEHLSSTQFPATYADLSFSARMEYDTESLIPYKDSRPYRTLDVKTKEEWCVDHPNLPECKEEKEEEKDDDDNDDNNNNNGDDEDDGNDNQDDGDEDIEPEPEPESTEYIARIRKRSPLRRQGNDGVAADDGKGCFAVCGQTVNDNLNNKALHKVMGKYYCADKSKNGRLVENDAKSKELVMSQEQLDEIRNLIETNVADKDKCDGHGRNYIFFVGTRAPDNTFTEVEEIFLDD